MFNTILAALLPSAWFYAGYAWAKTLRLRPHVVAVPVDRVVPVEVERLPAQYQVLDAQLRSAASRARLVGPGYDLVNTGTFTVDGLFIAVHLHCNTNQLAPAPEKDAHR